MKAQWHWVALAAVLGVTTTLGIATLLGYAAPGNPVVHPTAGSHTAARDTHVSITYDETISSTTVSSRTFVVHARQRGLLAATYGVTDGQIILTPTRSFHPGELVQVSATTGTLSVSGTHPLEPTVWQFHAGVDGGTGVFEAHPVSPTFGADDSDSMSVALGDLDGDGDLDAVVANEEGPDDVFLNDSAGAFTPHPISPTFGTGANQSWAVSLGDVDGDHDLDAVVVGFYGRWVFVNDGTGGFAPHPTSPTFGSGWNQLDVALADLDGDGDLDALSSGCVRQVYLNDGTGIFTSHPLSPTFGTGDSRGIAVGDVDGDGDLDVVAARAYTDTVHLNDGTGRFLPHPISPTFGTGSDNSYDVALGDVDADGDLDAVLANCWSGEAETVYLNDGLGKFSPHPITHTFGGGLGGCSDEVVLGDVDADGDLDAFVTEYNHDEDTVWLNDGQGVFHDSGLRLGPSMSYDVALGDVDDDGDLDAVVANLNVGGIPSPQAVWLNRGGGGWSEIYLPLVMRQ